MASMSETDIVALGEDFGDIRQARLATVNP
jgi:hypothetical protein